MGYDVICIYDFCSCPISLHNPPHEGSYVLKGHMNIINDL